MEYMTCKEVLMTVVTSTEFVKNFGRLSLEAQREPVAITSHGHISGYYVSKYEYERLLSLSAISYRSIRETVLAQKKAILDLAKKRKALRIRLFGSVAAGTDTPKSDIDFLVEFPKDYDLLKHRVGLAGDLEDLLGRRIDLIVEAEMNPEFSPSILAGAMDL
jgi:predicted nucleotidyltransferase